MIKRLRAWWFMQGVWPYSQDIGYVAPLVFSVKLSYLKGDLGAEAAREEILRLRGLPLGEAKGEFRKRYGPWPIERKTVWEWLLD